jgi:hypothetical protein
VAPWPFQIVCDGQSIMNSPGLPNNPDNIPYQLRIALGTKHVFHEAQNGLSITALTPTLTSRLEPYITDVSCDLNIWLFCGGNSDLSEEDTGQEIYDELVAYRDTVMGLGYDLAMATTITPNRFSPILGHEDERLDFNDLILANADDKFDAVIDLEVGIMADYNSIAYNPIDNTHPTSVGSHYAAHTLIAPAVEPFLP